MSMPPEVMAALQRNKPAGAEQPAPSPGPAAGGAMMPQKPAGAIEAGRLKVLTAMKVLEQALVVFGAMGKEGKAVLGAISSLAKTFGKQEGDADELMSSEKKTVAGAISGPGGSAPQGGAPPPGAGAPPMMPPGGAPPPA